VLSILQDARHDIEATAETGALHAYFDRSVHVITEHRGNLSSQGLQLRVSSLLWLWQGFCWLMLARFTLAGPHQISQGPMPSHMFNDMRCIHAHCALGLL
jgi:hypothetical protein